MTKRDAKLMKCRRCGQWIPLGEWKYAAQRLTHDRCASLASEPPEPPRGTVLRRRGGLVRAIQ
jgi:hypothetical protein